MAGVNAIDKSNSQAAVVDKPNIEERDGLLDTPNTMAKPPVYRALLALKPDGLSLGRWATEAGLARNYFNGLEKHGNPGREALDSLLSAISASRLSFERALDHAESTQDDFVLSEVAGFASGVQDVRNEFRGEERLPPLKLLGSALGGEFASVDEHIELTELHLSEILDYLVRPASLAKDPGAYALTIVGESMRPRFKPGERVTVSPRAALAIGDDVIVQLRAAEGEDDRVTMVLIKELVRKGSDFVELRQYNPDLIFRVEQRRIAAMHKVKGIYF